MRRLVLLLVLCGLLLVGCDTSVHPVMRRMFPAGTARPIPPVPPTEAPMFPPRISLEDFKALYDDPATRPLILDVQDPLNYAKGHIRGAISFPETDLETHYTELPKDRLIVGYCQ